MYTLRFPFRLPPGQEIEASQVIGEIDSLTFSLEKHEPFYVFTIRGFPTEDTADRYINNVWAGLMWVVLHLGLWPEAIYEPQKVVYTEDPCQAPKNLPFKNPSDGLIIGGNSPAVYPSEERPLTVTGGHATVLLTTHAVDVIRFFREGLAFPESNEVITDQKLRVAFELYGPSFTEFSLNAKFLTLIMALEALATGIHRTPLVLNLLDKWKQEVAELRSTLDSESEDNVSLDALNRELLFKKEDSIRRQIRNLVFTTLQANGDTDANGMGKLAQQLYDHRSTLVHDGKLESSVLGQAASDAKKMVERVLRIRFIQKAAQADNSNTWNGFQPMRQL